MGEEKKPRGFFRAFLWVLFYFFVIVLVLVIFLVVWLWIKNPMNVRGIMLYKAGLTQIEKPSTQVPETTTGGSPPAAPARDLPISEAQKEALESAGIDPGAIQITPEMEECFIGKLGPGRVKEIIAGDVPGPIEVLKASTCL